MAKPVTGGVSFRFDPKSEAQKYADRVYSQSDLLFLLGAAGTGKTYCALGMALGDILQGDRKRKQLVIVRPAVPCGTEIGFLPGDLAEKMGPFWSPIRHVLERLAFNLPPAVVRFETLAYMRGETFDDAVMLLDEAQNVSMDEFRLFLSRCGRNSNVLISGDPLQSDLLSDDESHDSCCDLMAAAERLDGAAGVNVVTFPAKDNFRHARLSAWLKYLRG